MNIIYNDKDIDEIIALEINKIIYFGQLAKDKAFEIRIVDKIYCRAVFKLMSNIDLDKRWGEWAKYAPTLFLKSEYDNWIKRG